MGIFDIFKKKGSSHEEKVDLAYRCYKPDMVGTIFPGGKNQASKVIISLAKIYDLDLNSCDAKKYYDILTTYSDVLIRIVITQSSKQSIAISLQEGHSDLVKSKEVAQKVLAYVVLNINNNNFCLESEEDLSLLNFTIETFSQMEETTQDNFADEQENLDDPEYGLVPNKPIFVHGVDSSYQYLDELKTISGEALTWNRSGSIGVDGIHGLVDIYKSFLPSGEPYKTVYINMYGSDNSQRVPNGFKR